MGSFVGGVGATVACGLLVTGCAGERPEFTGEMLPTTTAPAAPLPGETLPAPTETVEINVAEAGIVCIVNRGVRTKVASAGLEDSRIEELAGALIVSRQSVLEGSIGEVDCRSEGLRYGELTSLRTVPVLRGLFVDICAVEGEISVAEDYGREPEGTPANDANVRLVAVCPSLGSTGL